jgi:hypothetical protein
MLSLIQPFLQAKLIQKESILVNEKDKTIEFKFLDTVGLFDIIRQFLNRKNTDEVFNLLQSKNIGNYKINVNIPSISNFDKTKSFRKYMWFKSSPTGKNIGKSEYQINYNEPNN